MKNITNSQSERLLPICEENAPTFLSAVYNRARKRQEDAPQSGRSMIEMLGVLAIVGVLSVGGIAGYSKAMQKYRVNKTIDQITQISNGIHTLYTSRNNYEGLDIQLLGKAKVIPQELIGYEERNLSMDEVWAAYDQKYSEWQQAVSMYGKNSQQSLELQHTLDTFPATITTQTFYGTNPFDGRVLLSVDGDGKAFSINYLGLPEDVCIEVLTQDWGTSDLIAVGVDSQITSTYGCTGDKGTHVCNNQLPVSVDKAMTLCGQQNDSKGVILKFR